jgi:type I restriction enzyme, S subunit
MNHAPLGSLCNFTNGGTPPKSVDAFWNGNIPWITSADIDEGVVSLGRSFISEEAVQSSATNRVKQGTVLLVSRTGVGKVTQAPIDLCFSQDITAIEQNDDELDRRYLVRFLEASQDHFERHARGATIKGITREVIAQLRIPLPSLSEQRRIAAVLDKADALRRKRKRALDLLDSLSQAIFRRTFIKQHSRKWPKLSVESLARDMRTGPFGSQLLHSEFVDDGVAVLGIDNVVTNEFRWEERRYISEEKYDQLRRYKVSPGDVLITIMGTCGRCAIVPKDIPIAINTKHLCCITLDKKMCLPEFLQATFLQHPDVLQQLGVQAKGAVMPGLNMSIIKSLSISLPPIDLQQTFAREISKLKSMLVFSRIAEVKAADLFSSLQSRAFSGQL